jgi:AraC family transcriptional regulator, ethanolamine operon transcriptional activator
VVHSEEAGSPRFAEITDVRDPTAASSSFEFLDQDLVQLPSAEAFRARQVIVRLEGCIVVYYSTNAQVRTRPRLQRDYIAFVTFGPRAIGTANGVPVRGDVVVAVPAGQSLAVVAQPGYESASFLVPLDDVAEHMSDRGRLEVFDPREQVQFLHVDSGMAEQLFAWGRRLVDTVLEQPDVLEDSRERREAAKADLLETLLSALASASEVELDRRERTRRRQSDVVRAVEEFAVAHRDDRLYVKDLCEAAGVSERTLEYAFRAEMGISPVAYLTRIRLHKVHESLLRSSSTQTTVTQEALRWGFWHFGEFARAYKDCFQELPSDTLRRGQGRPAPGT